MMNRRIFKTCATLLAITVMGCGPTRSQTATGTTSPQQKQERPVGIPLWPALAETWLHTIHVL
jgi:hypothetical protein